MSYSDAELLNVFKGARDRILDDITNSITISSWSVAGQAFSYSSVEERTILLRYIEKRIKELTPGGGGFFQLARFGGI